MVMAKLHGAFPREHNLAHYRPFFYAHTPIQQMQHDSNASEVEQFINLGENELLADLLPADQVQHVEECHAYSDRHPWLYDALQPTLRQKYFSEQATPKQYPSMFSADTVNVAVHIRRGDVLTAFDCDAYSPASRCMPLHITAQIMLQVAELLRSHSISHPINFQIFSENATLEIPGLEAYQVQLNADVDLLRTFHAFVTADVLIIDHSSFSYAGALFNDNLVVWNSFWHSRVESWLDFDVASGGIVVHNEHMLAHKIKRLQRSISSRQTTSISTR